MNVKIQYLGFIRNLINQSDDSFELNEGTSLMDLLNKLADKYGHPFEKEFYERGSKEVKMGFVVTVNGVLSGQLKGVETKLNNGDTVVLMSLMSGG